MNKQGNMRWVGIVILVVLIVGCSLLLRFFARPNPVEPRYLIQLPQADPKVVMAYSKACGEIMRRHKERSFAIAGEVIEGAEDKKWYTLFKKYRVETEKDLNMLKGLNVPKGLEGIHGLMADALQYCIEGYSASEREDFKESKRKAEKAADIFNHKLPSLMQKIVKEKI